MEHQRLRWIIWIAMFIGACQGGWSQSQPSPSSSPEVTLSPTLFSTSTITPTSTQTPTPQPAFGSTVSVVFVSDQQSVAVLANPNDATSEISQLEANQANIPISGNYQIEGDRLWVEIQLPQGAIGWVDAQYITTTYPADQFCSNPQVQGLAYSILEMFKQKDGTRLSRLISPIHGLRVRTQWSNPEIFLGNHQDISQIFSDTTTYVFGTNRLTQAPIQGTFMETIYPMLLDIQEGGIETCNTLQQGLAADWVSGFIQWPFEYANLNYLALFRPAPPEDELNWRMWAFGIEFLNQSPYLTVIVHYQWDF